MAKVDDFGKIIMGELEGYANLLVSGMEEAGKAAGKAAVWELKQTSPKKTGEYAKGWKTKTTKTRLTAETVIYQGLKPDLAHLLEFGHPSVTGGRIVGRTEAHPHIKQAEANAAARYEQELVRRIEHGD